LLDSLLQEMIMKTYSDYIVNYGEYGGFDVKLVVHKECIYAHRLILSAGSNYMKLLLKNVDIDEEPATIMLPDFTFPEVANFVNILYNTQHLNSVGVVPQIFNELAFNDLKLKGDDPAKESIQMILDDDIKEEICVDDLLNTELETLSSSEAQYDDWETKDFKLKSESRIEKKTRGPGKKKKLKSDLAESGEKKKRGRKKIYPENGEYRCNECEYVGKCKRYLDAHINKRHLDVWFNCEYKDCEKRYRSKHYLSGHITKDHKGRLFYCDKCSYKSKFNDLLKLHIMKHHEGVRFICDRCGHEAPNPKSLGYHIKIDHEGLTYPCDKCDFVGKTHNNLWHHKTRTHSTQNYMCDKCTFVAPEKNSLRAHVRTVHCEKSHVCAYCDFSTKKIYSLKRHQFSKHKEHFVSLDDFVSPAKPAWMAGL